MRNSHSRSFKSMHFGITEKLTTDCVSLYNNAGLISSFRRNSQWKHWKLPFSTIPQLSFDAPPREPLRISIPTFLPLIVWVYLHSNFCGLRKTHLLSNRVRVGRSRSVKIVDFGVRDFLLVINSNFGPILHRFWDTATYWLKIVNFPPPFSFNALARGEPFRISR